MADGGSSDNTIKVAKSFGCSIIKNPFGRAEPGAVLAHKKSKADIKIFFAADNALPGPNWVRDMVTPFIESPSIQATYTHIQIAENDNSLNKYYSFLHVEPFTWFIYGKTCNPRFFDCVYPEKKYAGYSVFDFSTLNHPLLALAQGFCVRANFDRESFNNEDDIIPVIQMIKQNNEMAYVPTAGIFHYHLFGIKDFIKKYNWRIMNSLKTTNVGFSNRAKYQSRARRLLKYLWLCYSFSIIFPVLQSLFWAIRERRLFPLWHAPICLLLSGMILINVAKASLGRRN